MMKLRESLFCRGLWFHVKPDSQSDVAFGTRIASESFHFITIAGRPITCPALSVHAFSLLTSGR